MAAKAAVQSLRIARKEPRLALLDPAQHPVAVVLDLVQPVRTGRRARDQRREHRRQHRRQLGGLRAFGIASDRAAALSSLRRGSGWFGIWRWRRPSHCPSRRAWIARRACAPSAISSRLRPVVTLLGAVSTMDGVPGRAYSSFSLISSHALSPVLPPYLLPRVRTSVQAALQVFAVELELEMALGVARDRIFFGPPGAAIPEHHGAAAVLPLRDHAFEARRIPADGPRHAWRAACPPDRDSVLWGSPSSAARH